MPYYGDFSGEGIPYLYVYSSIDDEKESFEIYGWEGNTLKLVYDTEEFRAGREYSHFFEDEQGKLKMEWRRDLNKYESITYKFMKCGIEEVGKKSNTWE